MGMSINGYSGGMNTTRLINNAFGGLYGSLEKLSSGLRINHASDSPAELVISEKLRSQIASLNQEIENTSALINKYQSASSTVSELRHQLTEVRSLAVGAANEGGNSEAAQAAYAATATYIEGSFNRIAGTAVYNGSNLLDGSEGSVADVSALEEIDLSSAEAAVASIEKIDEAIAELDNIQVELGAKQKNELESRRSSLQITSQNLQAAESQLRDTDFAIEYSNMFRQSLTIQASMAMLAHQYIAAESVLKLMGE